MYNTSAIRRRRIKLRRKIAKQDKPRLTVYKSNKHIYAQLYTATGSNVILSSSSLDKDFKERIKNLTDLTKTQQAEIVGSLVSEKIKNKNIDKVVFDRSGFKFHGRIKALADAVLKNGIFC